MDLALTDRELKKLSRTDLLELLLAQVQENANLQKQLEEVKEQLQKREIAIDRAGTLAEASLLLNGVFDAAEAAGAQYLENIRRLSGEQERVCAALEQDTRTRCEDMLAETEEKCRQLEQETQEKCDALCAEAEKRANRHWLMLSKRIEALPEDVRARVQQGKQA